MSSMKSVPNVPLPDLSHLRSTDYEAVYEPSDDTFLLIDALSADVALLRERRPSICVEIGSGSGAVLAHVGSLLPPSSTGVRVREGKRGASIIFIRLCPGLTPLRAGVVHRGY